MLRVIFMPAYMGTPVSMMRQEVLKTPWLSSSRTMFSRMNAARNDSRSSG